MVQRLGLRAFNTRGRVQSLVRELRCWKMCGAAKKKSLLRHNLHLSIYIWSMRFNEFWKINVSMWPLQQRCLTRPSPPQNSLVPLYNPSHHHFRNPQHHWSASVLFLLTLFAYLGLCLVLLAVWTLPWFDKRGFLSSCGAGFSSWWLLSLQSPGSRAHRLQELPCAQAQ